ncbi:MAG: PAS domain-containing protein [Rhizomicrobium sp.]|jgi:hypothetical protein
MPKSSDTPFHKTLDETAIQVVTLEGLESPIVKLAADYWCSLRNGRRFPAHEDLYPRDMARILRDTILVKIIEQGADYEYRILGDAQVQAYSIPLQGRRISDIADIAPWFRQIAMTTYEYVRQSGEPLAMRGSVGREFPEAKFVYHESLFLPLGDNENAVDHLLIVSTNVFNTFSKETTN